MGLGGPFLGTGIRGPGKKGRGLPGKGAGQGGPRETEETGGKAEKGPTFSFWALALNPFPGGRPGGGKKKVPGKGEKVGGIGGVGPRPEFGSLVGRGWENPGGGKLGCGLPPPGVGLGFLFPPGSPPGTGGSPRAFPGPERLFPGFLPGRGYPRERWGPKTGGLLPPFGAPRGGKSRGFGERGPQRARRGEKAFEGGANPEGGRGGGKIPPWGSPRRVGKPTGGGPP